MIICGDNANMMAGIPDESVDLIVTDPPYGLKFMGKAWDKAVPSVDIWRECLRVLKPGAFAFVMCIPRQDCLARMIVNLEDAGFEVGFTSLYHAFASGFPKAMSMSKAVDRRLGAEREVIGRYMSPDGCDRDWEGNSVARNCYGWSSQEQGTNRRDITAPATPEAQALDGSFAGMQLKPAVEVVIVAMKPLAHSTYIDQALDNAKGCTWLDDGRIPLQVGDKKGQGGDHKEGTAHNWCGHRTPFGGERRFNIGRFPANLLVSDDALNDGQHRHIAGNKGTQLCAADMAEAVYAGGWQQYEKNRDYYKDSGSFSRYFSLDNWWAKLTGQPFGNEPILVEVFRGDEKIEEVRIPWTTEAELELYISRYLEEIAVRFAWQDNISVKVPDLPESVQRTYPFLIVPKAARSEKWFWCKFCEIAEHSSVKDGHDDHNTRCLTCGVNFNNKNEDQKAQHKGHKTETNILMHPTQKPVKLFAYLITIGSRPGDIVADMFGGVGTMGVAAKLLGRRWLMIEIGEEWCQIGRRRVEAVVPKLL